MSSQSVFLPQMSGECASPGQGAEADGTLVVLGDMSQEVVLHVAHDTTTDFALGRASSQFLKVQGVWHSLAALRLSLNV